jgi:uncharacterized protein (TIGR00369 family)
VSDDTIALSDQQLVDLAQYFNEEVTFSRHIGAKVEEVEPGRSVITIDVKDIHLNGAGTLHGGVYASLIDTAMGLSVLALVGVRTATIEMNVHFLGAVSDGRITCQSQVVHRTRRTATAEAKVRDSFEPQPLIADLQAAEWPINRPSAIPGPRRPHYSGKCGISPRWVL